MIATISNIRDGFVRQFPELNPENTFYKWLVLGSVMIATFMAVLDATIVNVALSKLMASFGVSVDQVEWILTAYLLVFGVILPPSGWMADHWGYKRVFITGLFLFTLGSFLSSLSWTFGILIFFRVVQGAGAGLLLPVGLAIITREFPPEKRGVALGFWSVAASASVSLGPTVGGYLIDKFSWHTIFDVNVPIGILGMAASFIILREYKTKNTRKFDFIGLISMTAFLAPLLLALANGNSAWNTGGWTSNYILINLAISFVAFIVFIINEFSVKHPLIEISLFKSLNFTISNLVLFIFGLGMFGSNFLLPIYLQNSLGYTPFQAGLVFLPVGVILGLTAPFAGYFSDKFSGKIPSIIGLVLLALTLYQYSFLSFLSERAQIMIPLYIRGFAMGLIFSPLTTIAISEIPNAKMAQASGLINVIRQIGGSFGVAIFGTVLTRRIIFHTSTYGEQINQYSESFRRTVIKLQHYVVSATGGTANQAAVKAKAMLGQFVAEQAFIQGIDDVFRVAAVIVLISAIPVFFLRSKKRQASRDLAAME